MFRKSRKANATTSTVPSESQSPRFLQSSLNDGGDADSPAGFSVGSQTTVKPKSLGFFSRLFKRSKEGEVKAPTVVVANGEQPRKKSLWQRSKSMLRPRAILDRSESAVLDLPTTQLNIRGSGSAAQLLMNEFPVEEFYETGSAVDTDGLLMRIFEANHVMYEQLKAQERQKDAERMNLGAVEAAAASVVVSFEGLITPVMTATELEECPVAVAAVAVAVEEATIITESIDAADAAETVSQADSVSENGSAENVNGHHHFADDPQLDSPLYRNVSESFSTTSEISSASSTSLASSVQSFIDGNFSLEGVESLSLTEMADMFDCLTVNEPETLKDGSVRCVFENENGSQESIRFHNWKLENLRSTRSEDMLKMTEISVAAEINKITKQRSMSLAALTKVENQVPVDRRRSLGAKVSQIVAMFEGAHF